jgi:membrane protease YdiL (CAAX protease family)
MMTIRYKRPDIRQVFEWSLISLFIWLISLVEINILNPNFNYFEHHENRHTLISGFYYLISAPLTEEVFMKSIFMESLMKLKLKKVFVILLSSACFVIFHFPSILIVHLLMGLVTSFLYYRNKDVVQCILIHSIYNGILGIESQFY